MAITQAINPVKWASYFAQAKMSADTGLAFLQKNYQEIKSDISGSWKNLQFQWQFEGREKLGMLTEAFSSLSMKSKIALGGITIAGISAAAWGISEVMSDDEKDTIESIKG